MTLLFCWSDVVAKVTLPLKAPVPVGANVIVTEAVPPECKVSGKERLLIENPAPLKVACVTLRSLPPLFDRVTLLVWLDPTFTFPKEICEGFGASCPIVTPLPVKDTVASACEFGSVNVALIVGLLEVVGSNWTLKETVCPATSVSGKAMPVTWKPEPTP